MSEPLGDILIQTTTSIVTVMVSYLSGLLAQNKLALLWVALAIVLPQQKKGN